MSVFSRRRPLLFLELAIKRDFPAVIGGFCVPHFYHALCDSLIVNEFNILQREIRNEKK